MRAPLVALVALLVLGGCSDSSGGTYADPKTSPTTIEDLCHRVSDADLTAWVGSEAEVQDAEVDGDSTHCEAKVGGAKPDLSWSVEWSLEPETGSLESMTANSFGASHAKQAAHVELRGEVPAYEIKNGPEGDSSLVIVTTIAEQQFINVLVGNLAAFGTVVPIAKLSMVAREIAAAYTA